MKVTWRAWTESGCFDSSEHEFEDLPDDGILFIMVYYANEKGRIVRRQLSGDDWYFCQRKPGRADLIGSNRHDPESTARRYPGCIIKRGKWTDDLTFQEVQLEAMASVSP